MTRGAVRVLYPFVGDTIGGSHISTLELIAALPRAKVEPIIVLHQDGPLAEHLRQNEIAFIEGFDLPLFSPKRRLYRQYYLMWRTAPQLSKFLKKQQIDWVHTNDGRMHVTWIWAAKKSGANHVWHQRNTWDFRNQHHIARHSSQIVTISEYCRSSFHRRLRDSVKTVWNPVTLQKGNNKHQPSANLRESLSLPEDVRLIAYIGNFMDRKQPLICVDVAAELRRRQQNNAVILMFGEAREPFGSNVRKMIAKKQVDLKCRIMGAHFPIIPLLQQCDALLAPAINEGFGRTLVEAMLCDVPVVAADHGGHREIVEDGKTGYLVDPESADEFADRLTAVLECGPAIIQMRQSAREMANKKCSAEAHVEAMLAIYNESGK